jgi:hypothetical protein
MQNDLHKKVSQVRQRRIGNHRGNRMVVTGSQIVAVKPLFRGIDSDKEYQR